MPFDNWPSRVVKFLNGELATREFVAMWRYEDDVRRVDPVFDSPVAWGRTGVVVPLPARL